MSARSRTYSRTTQGVLKLLGSQIKLARKQRRMSEDDLAERIGISRTTLKAIEKGSPKVEIGLAIEAATILGLPLFADPKDLPSHLGRIEDKLALLPRSIRTPDKKVKDDF